MPSSRAASGEANVTGAPSKRISPASGIRTPDSVLTSVLLPAPLSPISATTSPAWTVKSAPRRACTRPKLLTRPCASNSGSLMSGRYLSGAAGDEFGVQHEPLRRRRRAVQAREGERRGLGTHAGRVVPHDGGGHRQQLGQLEVVEADQRDVPLAPAQCSHGADGVAIVAGEDRRR